MRFHEILTEAKGETLVMYHGTALDNVPSILQHGLRPSEPGDSTADQWATLGGVYLSHSFDFAVRAARSKYPNEKLAVIVVEVNTSHATPDEDVVQKALMKAFTNALDQWGIDDHYEADLETYADHEEQRPLDRDDKPFDRDKFFKDFWNTVFQNMSAIAGTPRKRDPELVATAIELAKQLVDEDLRDYVDLTKWQAIKAQLVRLYPRLRSSEQYAKADLAIDHNIRLTKPIPPKRIQRAMTQDEHGGWMIIPRP